MASNIIPFNAFVDLDGISPNPDFNPRERIDQADIILAVDVMSGRESVLRGGSLWLMVKNNAIQPPLEVEILRIGLDEYNPKELVAICTIIDAVKGPEHRLRTRPTKPR